MRILALEPFFGGSHRAFLEGWRRNSRHDWTVIGLPGCHWKWRMRHAALQFASQVSASWRSGSRWDAILCSDMLDLAQFRGLTAKILANVPAVAYFHENQLTYPVRTPHERDLHFAFTNFMTAVAADQVWFNSAFHRREFLDAVTKWLRKMPDFIPDQEVALVRKKSVVQSPGIDCLDRRNIRTSGPLRIAWAARWEHDKNPELFFDAIQRLKNSGCEFRLFVFGESFQEIPRVFSNAEKTFAEQIDHWGFIDSREAYLNRLGQADVIVSTAAHEFFGLAVMEGISLGLYPVLPQRLSYPELLQLSGSPEADPFFYDGSPYQLSKCLSTLANDVNLLNRFPQVQVLTEAAERYRWPRRAAAMDDSLERIANKRLM